MDGWRVYVGDSCLLDSDKDEIYRVWVSARDVLAEQIQPFLEDTCADCRSQGTEAHRRLLALRIGREFAAEIDGDFYLLVREDHPLGQDAVSGLVGLAQAR